MHRRRAAVDQLLSRFGQLFPVKECPGIISRPFFAVFPLPLGQIFKIEEIRPAAFQKAAFGIKNCPMQNIPQSCLGGEESRLPHRL